MDIFSKEIGQAESKTKYNIYEKKDLWKTISGIIVPTSHYSIHSFLYRNDKVDSDLLPSKTTHTSSQNKGDNIVDHSKGDDNQEESELILDYGIEV